MQIYLFVFSLFSIFILKGVFHMSNQLEKKQKQLLFALEEKTNVPYLLMKKLLKETEKNSVSEVTQKERIKDYRALIRKYMNKEN